MSVFVAVLLSGSLAPDAMADTAARAKPMPASLTSSAAARAQADLLDAERRRAEAVATRDTDALRRLIGGEYYHVESNGRIRTKTEFLQMLLRDEFEFRSYEIDDVDIALLGNGRVAVVTGRIVAQMRGPNRSPELRGRFVRIWILENDDWRNTLHQITEIKSSATIREASRQLPR